MSVAEELGYVRKLWSVDLPRDATRLFLGAWDTGGLAVEAMHDVAEQLRGRKLPALAPGPHEVYVIVVYRLELPPADPLLLFRRAELVVAGALGRNGYFSLKDLRGFSQNIVIRAAPAAPQMRVTVLENIPGAPDDREVA